MSDPRETVARAVHRIVDDHLRDGWPTRDLHGYVTAIAEKALIERALAHCGWNKSATAFALGIHRATLDTAIRRHRIAKPQKTPSQPAQRLVTAPRNRRLDYRAIP